MPITVVGLGPGSPDQLTIEARDVLLLAERVYLRTRQHPSAGAIPPSVEIVSFDDEYEAAESFETLYERIVGRLLEAAASGEVVYAVPGHPLVGEATVAKLRACAGEDVRIVAGLSFVEPALTAVGVDPFEAGLQIVDALAPSVDPFRPALVGQIYNERVAGDLKLSLLEQYPAEHPVQIVSHAGLPEERVVSMPLYEIDRTGGGLDHLACLYLPALPLLSGLGSHQTLKEVVARLRRECPWDREQTHESLRPYLIEETFEALEALETGDLTRFSEELGDVLLQIYLHGAIAEESDNFSLRDVMAAITAKLIRRHPHVFGDLSLATAEQVAANWEKIKRTERQAAGSMLDGVPKSMPALAYVQSMERRAAGVGFEWPNVEGAWRKLAEELDELQEPDADRFWELGDALFVMVDLARWYGFEAEDALRSAANRFRRRFSWMEGAASEAGRTLDGYSLDELLTLWDQSKPIVLADQS